MFLGFPGRRWGEGRKPLNPAVAHHSGYPSSSTKGEQAVDSVLWFAFVWSVSGKQWHFFLKFLVCGVHIYINDLLLSRRRDWEAALDVVSELWSADPQLGDRKCSDVPPSGSRTLCNSPWIRVTSSCPDGMGRELAPREEHRKSLQRSLSLKTTYFSIRHLKFTIFGLKKICLGQNIQTIFILVCVRERIKETMLENQGPKKMGS